MVLCIPHSKKLQKYRKDLHGVEPAYIITSMLEILQLKNFVIAKELSIDFKPGMSVITGETGAGKSLIVKSLDLLSGQQGSDQVIHPDEDMAFIEATFTIPKSLMIDDSYLDGDRLTVSRRFYRNRSTVNKVNYESVSLKLLKSIMQRVIFISAQHQVIDLMQTSNHLGMFDASMPVASIELRDAYQRSFNIYSNLKAQESLFNQNKAHLDNEINELKDMVEDVDVQLFERGEEAELQLKQKQCELLNERRDALQKVQLMADNASSELNALDDAIRDLNEIAETTYSFNAIEMMDALTTLHQTMTKESLDIEYLESIDLDEINARLNQIFKAKVKYQVSSIDALLDRCDVAKQRIKQYESDVLSHGSLSADLSREYKATLDLGIQLTQQRKSHIEQFEYLVTNQLRQLGMVDAQFSVKIDALDDIAEFGQDAMEFLFSANPNMALQPLKKVASGGELSRVMLALMVSHSKVMSQPLIIFDEVDVGVGGITANYMADVLKQMATTHQLIVITHLPQIARVADQHFVLSKYTTNGQTCVKIIELEENDIATELQRMVGGDVVTSLIK